MSSMSRSAQVHERPADGRVDVAVGEPGGGQRRPMRSASTGLTGSEAPAAAASTQISESGRNRDAASSMASSSASTMARARDSTVGSVTSRCIPVVHRVHSESAGAAPPTSEKGDTGHGSNGGGTFFEPCKNCFPWRHRRLLAPSLGATPDLAPALLVVEDDRALSALLVELLTGEGYRVDTAYDGQQGMHRGLTGNYDALVVDRGLPVMDGADLVALLRSRGITTPALILTARGSVEDRVRGSLTPVRRTTW